MGDNRDNSSDSRILSGVGCAKVNIVGKVWFIGSRLSSSLYQNFGIYPFTSDMIGSLT